MLARLGAALVLGSAASGCTLVGAGAGASIDALTPGPYEDRGPLRSVQLSRGQRVVVATRGKGRVQGRYAGVHGPTLRDPERYLLLEADDELTSVPESEIEGVAVEVSGKGWLYGGLAGLAVDATLIVVAAVAIQQMELHPMKLSESGCFC